MDDIPRRSSRTARHVVSRLAISVLLVVAIVGGLRRFRKPTASTSAETHAMIIEAERKATQKHKRILIVFGANWCYDCRVLNEMFQRPEFVSTLSDNYEVVQIDVGHGDKNQGLTKAYQVPIDQGIPAVAILESDGTLIYSQQHGEFENMRHLSPESVLDFLKRWEIKKS